MMFCFIYRRRIEAELDDRGRLDSLSLLRHVAHCESCRGWAGTLAEIEHELAGAIGVDSALERSEARILQRWAQADNNLNISDYRAKVAKSDFHRWISRVAALVLLGFVLSGIYLVSDREKEPRVVVEDTVAEFSGMMKGQVELAALWPDVALEAEIQNVKDEISGVVGFLQDAVPEKLWASNVTAEKRR